jgi:hypothetical protein
MHQKRRCTWCGQPRPEAMHTCEPSALAVAATPPTRPTPRAYTRPAPPRYDRAHGLGTTARGIVVTDLGWAHVSPDVIARLRARGIVVPPDAGKRG